MYTYSCVYACVCTYKCLCVYICIYVLVIYMCLHVYNYMCIYVCLHYTSTRTYTYACGVYLWLHAYLCLCLYMCLYIYICMCLYVYILLISLYPWDLMPDTHVDTKISCKLCWLGNTDKKIFMCVQYRHDFLFHIFSIHSLLRTRAEHTYSHIYVHAHIYD